MVEWLLLSYRVPNQPSALRVASWRALKQRGAVLLGPGLYALPETAENREALSELSVRITEGGGTAIAMNASAMTPDDQRALELKFEAARHDEYQQVIKSAHKLFDHIGREEATRDYRFAEVESLEQELQKVRRQLALVIGRDLIGLPMRAEAEAALATAEARLHQYLDNAYQEENQA
ncbi:MAG: Chromate resistance protein ChrB [Dehalococcoidia bacterium]